MLPLSVGGPSVDFWFIQFWGRSPIPEPKEDELFNILQHGPQNENSSSSVQTHMWVSGFDEVHQRGHKIY